MLSLEELQQHVEAYQQGRLSLDDFEDWFRDNSRGAYASRIPGISEAAAAVEVAFSEYSFQALDEMALIEELDRAANPAAQTPNEQSFLGVNAVGDGISVGSTYSCGLTHCFTHVAA
jgi:hypothetical protein